MMPGEVPSPAVPLVTHERPAMTSPSRGQMARWVCRTSEPSVAWPVCFVVFAAVGECAVQVPGALLRERSACQPGLRRGLLASVGERVSKHGGGVVVKGAALQELPQFPLLLQDGP